MGRFSPEVQALARDVQRKILEQVTDKSDPRYLALIQEDAENEAATQENSAR